MGKALPDRAFIYGRVDVERLAAITRELRAAESEYAQSGEALREMGF